MKFNTLKTIRLTLALLFFTPLLLYFCDFTNILPPLLHGLAHIQLVPAIMLGSVGILTALFLLTVLFGRIYCSVICPLGVLQDIIAWFAGRSRKKNGKKRRFAYAKPQTALRYSLLVACVLFLIFGITAPVLYLDPYSNFGRIAVNLFRPLAMEGNNLINWIALKFNNYGFYHVTIYTITGLSLTIAAVALTVVALTAFLRGRLFCNAVCPVGSLLGIISKFSVFRIVLDPSKCTSCGRCEKACKSQCIDSKEKTADTSRCVACFNCLNKCKSDGIAYRFALPFSRKQELHDNPHTSRRSFLLTGVGAMATLPFIPAWAKTATADRTKLTPITPPGSKSLTHFKKHCTACHLCITHCPQQILKPAGFNFGWEYAFKPHLTFYESAFCNYECTVCSEICPNGAIKRLTAEEKSVTQIGIARFDIERCVVYSDRTSCGACSEHCPTRAVKMEPYEGALTLPRVYDELCIGCGGCESICPVRPVKAINIQAVDVHQTAKKEQDEQIEEVDGDRLDFGF
ncbi:MAG: 4Fe-4S binding protein [Dysgonamonadaceae bacterium]|jgi:ferredoxin|nr:4Fe-4S binding protein [Dysgonamonadaceae bacterium]